MAIRAGLGAQVFGQLLAYALGFGLAVAPLQVGHDALEWMLALDHIAAVVEIAEGHLVIAGATEDQLAVFVPDLIKGQVQIDAKMLGQ